MLAIASKYNVSSARIALAWHLSRGTIALTTSKNIERQKENKDLPTLAPEDVQAINALDKGRRICNGPDADGKVIGWTLEQLGW
jgi:glycerol 2-dehydrogenase (NADP+)